MHPGKFLVGWLCWLLAAPAFGAVGSQPPAGGSGGAATNAQPPSTILTNASLTGVITNAPWTTNFAVGYDIGAAISNLPNNSIANVLPGTHVVTPVIWATNAGVFRYPPITIQNKTNITININGATIDGHAALGTTMLITNCDNIIIQGNGTFDGLVLTNIAELIATNVTWGQIAYVHSSNIKFKDFKLLNSHYHGIIDWGASFINIVSTNNILFDGLDIRNAGSKMTNGTINNDGSGIVLAGGTVRNCYFRDNFRSVEIYTASGNAISDNTTIENNQIYDTLDCPITTSASTNNNKILVANNFIYQTRGYSRRGTNYMFESGGAFIRMDGGQSHTISKNKIYGTNALGIYVGGTYIHNVEITDNYIEGPSTGINVGTDAPGNAAHRNFVITGNNIYNTGVGGIVINSCADGSIGFNRMSEFRFSFAAGIDVYPTQPNTNMVLFNNSVKDTSGNLYASYLIRANNYRIIMSNNEGTNGTQSFIENLAGLGLIYRGQRNNSGSILYSEALVFSAGSGTSNTISGGLMYYDGTRYTNHSTVGNYTNLAYMMVPEHTLTNIGDTITGIWRGTMRSPGTNTFVVGYGTETNIFATPTLANTRNTAYELVTMLTRTGNTTADAYMRWEISEGSSTVSQTNWMAVISPTHGVTNIFRLQAKGQGAGGLTNRFFSVDYQPAARL
jgi:hypothetical protein